MILIVIFDGKGNFTIQVGVSAEFVQTLVCTKLLEIVGIPYAVDCCGFFFVGAKHCVDILFACTSHKIRSVFTRDVLFTLREVNLS